jgi:hypothetical protein
MEAMREMIAKNLGGYKVCNSFPGRVHISSGSILYASKKNEIFVSLNGGEGWERLCRIPLPLIKRVLGGSILMRRLLRYRVSHLALLNDQTLLIFAYGRIFTFEVDSGRLIDRGTLNGKPLTLCMGERIYYGEYIQNPDRNPVHIWMSEDKGATWNSVWRFEGVRHIHGVSKDPFTGYIWVTTGDVGDECGIWITRDHFRTLEKVFGGNTQNTAIQLLFTKDYIFFGTDAPFEENYICRIDRKSYRQEEMQKVEGPIYYGTMAGNKLFFSTVCEKGNGRIPRRVSLWHSCDGISWRKMFGLKKDIWPLKYFQFGNIFFPDISADSNYLWVSPVAVEHSHVSLKLDIRNCCPRKYTSTTRDERVG